MPELQLNNIHGALDNGHFATLTASGTTITFASAPGFPTVASTDFVKIILEPDTANEEIVYLSPYTSGATTGTVLRGQEGTTAIAHTLASWVHGSTAADFQATLQNWVPTTMSQGLNIPANSQMLAAVPIVMGSYAIHLASGAVLVTGV